MKTKKASAVFALAFAAALLLYSMTPSGARSVSSALELCSKKLVPSVFISVTMSSFLMKSGLWRKFSKLVYRPFSALFGASRGAASVMAVGVLCGFPSAAACAASLYENGEIEKREAEHAAAVASLPSPSFVIAFVGIGLFGSAVYGIVLYVVTLFSAFLVGAATAPYVKRERSRAEEKTEFSAVRAAVGAISEGVMKTLIACGSVTLFSAAGDMICRVFDGIAVRAAVFGIFEVTGAAASAVTLPSPASIVLCAAALGFSGLSAACQIAGALYSAGLSASSYIPVKLCTAAVSALSAFMLFCMPPYVFPAFFFVSALTFYACRMKFSRKRC